MGSDSSSDRQTHCKVMASDNPHEKADYYIDLTEEDLKALKETARDADGRKTEVKRARELLGIR